MIYNIYFNNPQKPKKKMYFESVEVKKKKVNNFEYEKIYNSLLNKADNNKEELVIPTIPKNKRLSHQFNFLN